MIICGVVASTRIDKYFGIVSLLFFSLISAISAFLIGIAAYDLSFVTNGALLNSSDNSVGYLWTGWGLIMIIRMFSLSFVVFTESVNK